jgi:YggT family protein
MSIITEIVQGVGSIAMGIIEIYIWVIIINALLSFVNPDPYNPIVQFLHRITSPAYSLVRRFVRTNFNGLDLAPLIVIIGLQVILVLISAILHAI